MQESLTFCLSAPTRVDAVTNLDTWHQRWQALAAGEQDPVALALRGGFLADRVGWAFVAGYQSALRTLLLRAAQRQVPAQELLALCATEAEGNRPRNIRTTLTVEGERLTVSGEKSWTTLGPSATALLVVGRLPGAADPQASPTLKVAWVPADSPGISFQEKPPIAFVPEIPHLASRFDAVALPASALLPGDGYNDYVKPFRTVEDTFIALAVQAYLLREARARDWPKEEQQHLAAQLVTLATLAGQDASLATTHIALAGALDRTQQLYQRATELFQADTDPAAERWARDRPLFQVASKPRALRAERAWQRLAGPAE